MTVIACLALLLCPGAGPAFTPQPQQRIVFLGDSNTFAGTYVAMIDGYLATRFPDATYDLINLGLPSETASGLSEADHPYPRPSIHTRLKQALARTQPKIVVIGYGMNDGIYHPFAADRFDAHQAGIRKVIEQVRQAGATPVLLTPAPFDGVAVKAKLQPASAERFSWMRPYEDYGGVLARYAAWQVSLRKDGLIVADGHSAIRRHLQRQRERDPAYRVSGDGIHPNSAGHALMALELLRAWHAPAEVETAEIDAAGGRGIAGRITELKQDGGGLRWTWTSRVPMPTEAAWPKGFATEDGINEALNQYRLTVRGLPKGAYTLAEGDRSLGRFTAEQLAAGLDLNSVPDLTTNRRAAAIWPLELKRTQIRGRAWLDEIGHTRPDTPKGLPLAEAEQQASDLARQVRDLSQPVALSLSLTPPKP